MQTEYLWYQLVYFFVTARITNKRWGAKMQYTEYYSIERFLKITEKILLDNEIVNGLMYGIAETLKTDINYYGSDPLLATVSTDSSVELVIMMTPPYKIQILAPGKNRGEALDLLSKKLKENNWSVPAVIAEKEIAKSFSAKYCKLTDKKFKKTMSLRIYELTKVSDISLSEGKMRVATMDDYDLVFKWTKAFEKDCFGDTDVPEETQH
ncbi:MAG: hypothetical protein KAH30_03880, partial [Caldisericia bacterium]|nr:hypothetical protein [Caldisericia bacterium]